MEDSDSVSNPPVLFQQYLTTYYFLPVLLNMFKVEWKSTVSVQSHNAVWIAMKINGKE